MFQLHRSRSPLKLGPFKATIRNNALAETLGSGQVRRSADSFCGMLWEVEWPLIGESFAATNSIVAVKAAQALLAILKLASQHWSTSRWVQRFCFCVSLVLHVSIIFSKDLIALKPACDVHFSQLSPSHPNFDARLVSRILKSYCGTMHNEHVSADLTAFARHCRVACRQPRHCLLTRFCLFSFQRISNEAWPKHSPFLPVWSLDLCCLTNTILCRGRCWWWFAASRAEIKWVERKMSQFSQQHPCKSGEVYVQKLTSRSEVQRSLAWLWFEASCHLNWLSHFARFESGRQRFTLLKALAFLRGNK